MMPSVACSIGCAEELVLSMGIGSENWTLSVLRDALAASESAADIVSNTLLRKPDAAITFPTGTTPLAMFDILAARAARGEIDFSGVSIFFLDEFVGATDEAPNSFTRWLTEVLFNRVGIKPDQLHALPVTADDLLASAAKFDEAISARGG